MGKGKGVICDTQGRHHLWHPQKGSSATHTFGGGAHGHRITALVIPFTSLLRTMVLHTVHTLPITLAHEGCVTNDPAARVRGRRGRATQKKTPCRDYDV